MKRGFLIHYSEIGLKGKNRAFFERKLAQNIKTALSGTIPDKDYFLKRLYGRFFLEISIPAASVSERNDIHKRIEGQLQKVFGVANFSRAFLAKRDLDILKKVVWEEFKKQQPFSTFRIRARRSDKSFPLTSREVEFQVGSFVKAKSGAKVDLEKAEVTGFIEILSSKALFYFDKIPGPGGLPVSTAGKVVTLLSGGIDSPVASWMLAKRGARNIFVHFHSYPQTDKASQEKVRELVKILTEWQFRSKLYLVPLLAIQKEVVARCPTKLRVILYRRMMLRIAGKIATREGSEALATGESLGQVASQTLENIGVISY